LVTTGRKSVLSFGLHKDSNLESSSIKMFTGTFCRIGLICKSAVYVPTVQVAGPVNLLLSFMCWFVRVEPMYSVSRRLTPLASELSFVEQRL
jgi:hypothetical protein